MTLPGEDGPPLSEASEAVLLHMHLLGPESNVSFDELMEALPQIARDDIYDALGELVECGYISLETRH